MKTITIKIEDELREKLERVAEQEQRSLSNTARIAISEGLERFFLDRGSKHPKKRVA